MQQPTAARMPVQRALGPPTGGRGPLRVIVGDPEVDEDNIVVWLPRPTVETFFLTDLVTATVHAIYDRVLIKCARQASMRSLL